MKPIIKLENISYAYQANQPVLSDINLIINPGEDIALIGPNGSGKSTLGKLIVGLLKPKSGNIIFNNEIMEKSNILVMVKVKKWNYLKHMTPLKMVMIYI